MICPNCRTANSPNSLYCARCNAPLAAPSGAGASPFEDYQPMWLHAGGSPAVAPPPLPASVNGSAASVPSGQGAGLGFSLDDLLKSTEAGFSTPASPSLPAPSFGTAANGAPSSTASQGVAVPAPSFREPPLWARPATPPPNFNVRPEDLRTSSSAFERPPMASNKAEEPLYGVERGVYFYTDEFGEVVVAPLGSFLRRFGGAVIDNILMGIVVTILYFTVGSFLVGSLIRNSVNEAYRRGQTVARAQLVDQVFQLIIGLYVMAIVITFLYHLLLVGLGGQTLGHRFLKIKVLKKGGRAPGIVSASLRALYGTIPGLVGFVLLLVLNNVLANIIVLVLNLLVVIGLLWALIDRGKQGWHDKIASTYVISTQQE